MWRRVESGFRLLLLVVFFLSGGFVLALVLPPEARLFQFWFNAFVLGLGLVGYAIIQRLNQSADEQLNFSITGAIPSRPDDGPVRTQLREYDSRAERDAEDPSIESARVLPPTQGGGSSAFRVCTLPYGDAK